MLGPQYSGKSVVLKGLKPYAYHSLRSCSEERVRGQDCLPKIIVVVTFSLGEKKNDEAQEAVHVRVQGLNGVPSSIVRGLVGGLLGLVDMEY